MTATSPHAITPVIPRRPSLVRRILQGLGRFARRAPMSAFWGLVALLIVATAAAAPLVAPHDPLKSNFRTMTKPPSEKNFFGTDQVGRDTLSRVIHGSRT